MLLVVSTNFNSKLKLTYLYARDGQIRTVKVSNVSPAVSERDILEFFTFSGDIRHIEMQRGTETPQVAYVTFRDSHGVDRATLLTGATLAGLSISITPVENYELPPNATSLTSDETPSVVGSAVKKAEDVVSTMLAKGFLLGKGALNRAKSFDEKHQLTSNATATVASIDRRIGFTEKLSMGTAAVNEKVKEMDERLQVSEMTKSALAAAEQRASSAGSAIMNTRIVSAGASWFSSALSVVSKAAEGVSTMTREKVEKVEEERRENLDKERAAIAYNPTNDHHVDVTSKLV
ncbi:Binding partner of ACD11 1 [Sesamum angolense]|uniref:Binding partner of ACD11 1 n=1 Tax=Sesamum angolense TaxID=2727404 RepID=A0AAE2BWK7_9LAMI|nr:Binding partner of ACD11 1 [Sesamum angolense]